MLICESGFQPLVFGNQRVYPINVGGRGNKPSNLLYIYAWIKELNSKHLFLLPEFSSWIDLQPSAVIGYCSIAEAVVGRPSEVQRTVSRVPVIVAGLPWQLLSEGCEQIIETPCQDHVVVTIDHKDDGGRGPSNS